MWEIKYRRVIEGTLHVPFADKDRAKTFALDSLAPGCEIVSCEKIEPDPAASPNPTGQRPTGGKKPGMV